SVSELFPPWKTLQDALPRLSKGGQPLSVASGLAYSCVRLALEGRSVLVLTDADRADDLAEDARTLASYSDALKDWSVAFLPEDDDKERNALLEDAFEKKGLVWFASKPSFLKKVLSKNDFSEARRHLKV